MLWDTTIHVKKLYQAKLARKVPATNNVSSCTGLREMDFVFVIFNVVAATTARCNPNPKQKNNYSNTCGVVFTIATTIITILCNCKLQIKYKPI